MSRRRNPAKLSVERVGSYCLNKAEVEVGYGFRMGKLPMVLMEIGRAFSKTDVDTIAERFILESSNKNFYFEKEEIVWRIKKALGSEQKLCA